MNPSSKYVMLVDGKAIVWINRPAKGQSISFTHQHHCSIIIMCPRYAISLIRRQFHTIKSSSVKCKILFYWETLEGMYGIRPYFTDDKSSDVPKFCSARRKIWLFSFFFFSHAIMKQYFVTNRYNFCQNKIAEKSSARTRKIDIKKKNKDFRFYLIFSDIWWDKNNPVGIHHL